MRFKSRVVHQKWLYISLPICILVSTVVYANSKASYVPKFVRTYRFKFVGEQVKNGRIIQYFNSDANYIEVAESAKYEFANSNYLVSDKGSQPIFYRGQVSKAMLVRGVHYRADGTFEKKQNGVALWLSKSDSFLGRIIEGIVIMTS